MNKSQLKQIIKETINEQGYEDTISKIQTLLEKILKPKYIPALMQRIKNAYLDIPKDSVSDSNNDSWTRMDGNPKARFKNPRVGTMDDRYE